MKRFLGRSGLETSPLGMGCWAIGGPLWLNGRPAGWGEVNDHESMQAIQKALDLGITFFDTADVYGAGHSERLLGAALEKKRDGVIIATKFGRVFEETTRQIVGSRGDPEYIGSACDASLRRLKVDCIDLYQFHLYDFDLTAAKETRDALEALVTTGKIRYYGWSTDSPERAEIFAQGKHCVAIQQGLNVFGGNMEILAVCERNNLASINRGPLAMGILTGKFSHATKLPDTDVRSTFSFAEGPFAAQLEQLEKIKDCLRVGGRTLAQGALGWLWAKSGATLPIPGFKTVKQVEENLAAIPCGPLPPGQMAEIDRLLER
jgi:aryl-alcohol dehydrogenase-like predicted oxidoreductase